MDETLGPPCHIDFTIRDYQLFNKRPVPVGYDVAFSHHDLKSFLGYVESRHINKRQIVSGCAFDDEFSTKYDSGYGVICIYTDFLPDHFQIEHGGNAYDKDTEEFRLNLGCVTRLPGKAKPSQRLVLLEGRFSPELKDSSLDMDITIHYENDTWDGQYFPNGTASYIPALIAPKRISRPQCPITAALKLGAKNRLG